MAKVLKFPKFQDFLNHNRAEIKANYFVYYHLTQLIPRLNNKELDLYDAYNVTDETGNSVICVWVTGNYFIYSNKWTDEIITVLLEAIGIKKYRNFIFLGQREIIIELFEKSNIDYEIIKDRLIYKCTTVNELSLDHNCSVENASFEDFDELVQMSMDNYIEEYEGKGEKTLEEMQGMVANGISESSLYILRSDSELSSMLQIINPGRDYPMIGNLFTKKEMRGRGYASILLYTVTNGLLNNGFEMCGLISDVKNAASNKAFIKVGYTPIYKWIFISKSDSNTTNMPG